MQKLLDKLLLMGSCAVLFYLAVNSPVMVLIPLGITGLLSAINLHFSNSRIHLATFFIFVIICCFIPIYTIFLPVLFYDVFSSVFRWAGFVTVFPFMVFWDSYSLTITLLTVILFLFGLLLSYKTSSIELLTEDYENFRKTAHELSLAQEAKSKSLLENQDYQIQTATLNERNRISKEIHDHVGHVLSRSLLQIGALLTISKEPAVTEGLEELKSSISEGMDSIRASIHNIHDESIDLKASLEKLIHEFTYCPVDFTYSIKIPPALKIKYCFIAIAKEGLSNVIKHSNGDKVRLSLTEDDTAYYFVLEDNGIVDAASQIEIKKSLARNEFTEGLGLQSFYDRVKGFDGVFNIQTEQGFRIEITIPKEDLHEITSH